jgi:hypothetical protein
MMFVREREREGERGERRKGAREGEEDRQRGRVQGWGGRELEPAIATGKITTLAHEPFDHTVEFRALRREGGREGGRERGREGEREGGHTNNENPGTMNVALRAF